MAWSFGDGFDLYAAGADMATGYWDTVTSSANLSFVAGRFAGSQALQISGSATLVKSSGQNDAVHHLVCAFHQTSAITGSTLGRYLQLLDGATAQCSVVFRGDGAIVLTSGGPTGTALATYTGAFPLAATWYQFEIEVVINNTTGSFKVRKNGNPSDNHSTTGLNTRGGTANNYANSLKIGQNAAVTGQYLDDFFWRSDASSVAWLGDIRCHTRMPASDAAVTWARTPTGAITQTPTGTFNFSDTGSGVAHYSAFTASYNGAVTSVGVGVATVGTSVNMKCAIFADDGTGRPGALLSSAIAPVTPVVVGTHTFTFSGQSVVKGVQYWVGACIDGNGTFNTTTPTAANGASSVTAYAVFPQTSPVTTMPARTTAMSWTYTATPANWQAVSEAQQDALTSYVYSSTPGDADLYGIASIASTPSTVIATTVRAYMLKSDAGTRTAAVQLKSGATTVASATTVLTTSGWLWAWRTDTVDPNTSAAWTPAAVNTAQIGPKVIA